MSKKGATSVNMKPCDPVSAQLHCSIEHRKKLDYIREDLSHLNVEWHAFTDRTLKQCFDEACAFYEDVNHQKPQLGKVFRYDRLSKQKREIEGFAPIRCSVVVINEDTTEEDIVRLCEEYRKEWGVTPLAFSMHKDEGHYAIDIDEKTKEVSRRWIPNLHAHLFFDVMEYRPDPVEIAPEEGQKEDESKKGKNTKKEKKKYGKTIKFSPRDTSRMQDIAAGVLGMERGEIGSKRTHQNQVEYKRMVQAQELAEMAKLTNDKKEESRLLDMDIDSKNRELTDLNDFIEIQEKRAGQLHANINDMEQWEDKFSERLEDKFKDIAGKYMSSIEEAPIVKNIFTPKSERKRKEKLGQEVISSLKEMVENPSENIREMKSLPEELRQERRRNDENYEAKRRNEVRDKVDTPAMEQTNRDLRKMYQRETSLLDEMNLQQLSQDTKEKLLKGESVTIRKKWYDPEKAKHTAEEEATLKVSDWKLRFNGKSLRHFLDHVWNKMVRAVSELKEAARVKFDREQKHTQSGGMKM